MKNSKAAKILRDFASPYLNDEMEAILYGTESEMYKKHLILKRFFEKHKDESVFCQ